MVQAPQAGLQQDRQQQGSSSPLRAAAQSSFCEPACSSPMVNQCSPNLGRGMDRPRSPGSILRPHSSASVFNTRRQPGRWQQQLQQSPDSTPVMRHVQQWQQQQELLQHQHHQHLQGLQCSSLDPLGRSSTPEPAAAVADQQHTAGLGCTGDDGVADALTDEVLLYGELMCALRRAGGGLRAEAILEQLLQELGAARAGLSSEHGEVRVLRGTLAALQEEHRQCQAGKHVMQVGLRWAGWSAVSSVGCCDQAAAESFWAAMDMFNIHHSLCMCNHTRSLPQPHCGLCCCPAEPAAGGAGAAGVLPGQSQGRLLRQGHVPAAAAAAGAGAGPAAGGPNSAQAHEQAGGTAAEGTCSTGELP